MARWPRFFALATAGAFCLGLLAPVRAGEPPVPAAPEAGHPARLAGLRALEKQEPELATTHFLRALEDFPRSALLLGDLVSAADDRPALRTYWVHQWAAALSDVKGQVRPPKGTADLIAKDDPHPRELAMLRARLAAEAVRQAGAAKGPGALLVARAWARLFRIVAESSPALQDGYAAGLAQALEAPRPTLDAALREIEAGVRLRPGAAAEPWRLRLGLALIGLASQARQKLAGTPPDAVDRLLTAGSRLKREAETALASTPAPAVPVATLRAMDAAQVAEFNRRHTDPSSPGRAISEHGRYEVVTWCGHGTLVAAADEAERCHARLAAWVGSDPFEKQRGLVVVVPDAADLEAENAPYWWAAGFQRGLVTTIQFHLGSPRDLRSLLAHELCHRFDALLTPSMPPWLLEGRAVWTGEALTSLTQDDPEEGVADRRRIGEAPGHLYGYEEGLAKMLAGKPDDYRHHYTAGHGLWVFLTSTLGADGQPTYRARLHEYLAALRAHGADAAGLFRAHFCDGKDGRPADLGAFAALFREFLWKFREYPEPPEVAKFRSRREPQDEPVLLDRPTISRAREREEPTFGQDHVVRAAHALAMLGSPKGAILLLEWALAYDELDSAAVERLVGLLATSESRLVRAAALLEGRRRISSAEPEGGAGAADVLQAFAVKPLLDVLTALAAASKDYAAKGLADLALWFADEHDRLGEFVGRAPLAPAKLPFDRDARSVPVLGPPLALGARGWRPARLQGLDPDWTRPDLWHVTPEGELVVGRKAGQTLAAEHDETFEACFVRTREDHETGYVLSARLHLLTPFVDGHVVVGWQRPDRCVRFAFRAGERPHPRQGPVPMKRHQAAEVRLLGSRPFDGWHSWREQREYCLLKSEDSSFEVRIQVDGPRVDAWVDGRQVGSWIDAEGLPIDGGVGFATEAGVVRVGGARLERLRGRATEGLGLPGEHDVAAPRSAVGEWILRRRLRGVPPDPGGTFVLWLPLTYEGGAEAEPAKLVAFAASDWSEIGSMLTKRHHDAKVAVVAPRAWPDALRAALRERMAKDLGARGRWFEHGEFPSPAAGPPAPDWGRDAHCLFLDPVGIVRRYRPRAWISLPDEWLDWFYLTLGHGGR